MKKLDKFINGRTLTVIDGKLHWVEFEEQPVPLTEEEDFKFLTLSTQAYRESLKSTLDDDWEIPTIIDGRW